MVRVLPVVLKMARHHPKNRFAVWISLVCVILCSVANFNAVLRIYRRQDEKSSVFPVQVVSSNAAVAFGGGTDSSSSTGSRPRERGSSMARDIMPPDATRIGILSNQNVAFFRQLQQEIDDRDPAQRCREYGWQYNPSKHIHRRIFFGALIADETWELLDIISTETYGIFTGAVFVESNRTHIFTPRPFRHLHDTDPLQQMFHTTVQIRTFTPQDEWDRSLDAHYEDAQRQEILHGWKELGMRPDDVGLLSDTDELFTRDFLRAVQTCDEVPYFTYNNGNSDGTTTETNESRVTGHSCQLNRAKLQGTSQTFESSPECVTQDSWWYHPDMILGHCIDYIGDHPLAPRAPGSMRRAAGFGLE
jgi:Glycosyltransferase family 17